MARRGGRRTSVEIKPRTLHDLAGDLDDLSQRSLKRVLYGALDDVAADSVGRMRGVFERHIEGGPAKFTKVVPGSRSSSVVDNKARRGKGDRITSSIKVQRLQSRYLRFALGEDDLRMPNDVGAATEYNFVPNEAPLAKLGIRLTPEGNMPRSALKGLVRLSQRRSKRTKTGKKRAAGSRDGVFFGRSGRRKTMGFWQRSSRDAEKSNRAPDLLVLAIPRSRYEDEGLTRGWSRAVTASADEIPRIAQKRLAEVLARM